MAHLYGLPKFTTQEHHDTYPYIDPTQFDLNGRTILITGATGAIGRGLAVSYTLARASAICISARGSLDETVAAVQKAAESADLPVPKLLILTLDVTQPDSVTAAAAKFRATFAGGLDILVNNAGYLERVTSIADSDPKDVIQSINVNLIGPYLMSHAFLPILLDKSDGLKTIVNLSSIGAMMVLPGLAGYSSSKLGLARFTEYLSAEYGDKGVHAFTVHPGGVPSNMSYSLPEQYQNGALTETPELAADSIVWLSAANRDWAKARFLNVQWDMEEVELKGKEILEKDLLKVAFFG